MASAIIAVTSPGVAFLTVAVLQIGAVTVLAVATLLIARLRTDELAHPLRSPGGSEADAGDPGVINHRIADGFDQHSDRDVESQAPAFRENPH